ncbi:MAG: pyruvate dehydrogenase (acetyl-transferring), homodimeric type, partial [Betaproteobacteria bacterium]|nr:pyruvate dehydrogenase (acetyl-transferring), homodimeric type [Betaproteobacteria bacterium]
ALDGQILEEGISEAGSIASWTAAATSYSAHGLAMLPFYIYYSIFGFQRVGDQIWAAADQRARGFLLGATSGRTTLGGEGLQHQDGSSHLVAATIPNCKAWDPAFAGELAVIIDQGMREMMVEQHDVFYYITLMNENYVQPNLPEHLTQDLLRGCYKLMQSLPPFKNQPPASPHITLMGSGAILTEVIQAGQNLCQQGYSVTIFSVTSWSELARDGHRYFNRRLFEEDSDKTNGPSELPFITQQLSQSQGPILAASDYVRAVPESIRAFVPEGRAYLTLGTDGFGRSDTRARLREHFKVNAASIEHAALKMLGNP